MTEPAELPAEILIVQIATANERLRQQQVTFNRRAFQDNLWFWLRYLMGVVAGITLPAILFLAGTIILSPLEYSDNAVTAAAIALVADLAALMTAIWKIVMAPASVASLAPITQEP